LRKLNSSVELANTPETLGMIKKICYLIKID
ncbi:MAG: uL30 family ribosomal protein, partial [Proteobacteria bacterium]|nr:uL30 family ribosomal protein [Pseudomonadota bacterium]